MNKKDMRKDSLIRRLIENKKYIIFTTIFLLLILTSVSYVYFDLNPKDVVSQVQKLNLINSNETDIKTTEETLDITVPKMEDLNINVIPSETDSKQTENLEYQLDEEIQITQEQFEEEHNEILYGPQSLLSEDKNILFMGLTDSSDINAQAKSFLLARTYKEENLFEITLIPSNTFIKDKNSNLISIHDKYGVEETQKAIEILSAEHIDDIIEVDYKIFTFIIDLFDGVKLNNTKGLPINMSSTEALNYIRQTHPEESESNRLKREKNLLEAFANTFFEKEIIIQKSLLSNIYNGLESIRTFTSNNQFFYMAYYALQCGKDGIVINILPGDYSGEYFIPEK